MSLLFQPSDFTLMFKYVCVLTGTAASSGEGGKTPKFINSKQCKAALMPGWEISPSHWGGKWTVACQNICSPALVRCVNSIGSVPFSVGRCGCWLQKMTGGWAQDRLSGGHVVASQLLQRFPSLLCWAVGTLL